MREILFRGYDDNDKCWKYGQLFQYDNGESIILNSIYRDEDITQVIPETVGQYCGLEDKNDVKIFEGDCFNYFLECVYFVEFVADRGSYILTNGKGYDSKNCIYLNCDEIFNLEVIGNIFDNPELLEE